LVATVRGVPSAKAFELRLSLTETLRPLLAGVREVVVCGYGESFNAGESLIWLGQLSLLKMLGIKVRRVSAPRVSDPGGLEGLSPEVAVLLSGGGNFGDLWHELQVDRERIIKAAVGRRVIQLPQSLSYRDESNIPIMRDLLEAHGDVVLCWRDHRSYATALELFPTVTSVLVPDVAFALHSIRSERQPQIPILRLARTDHEGGELAAARVPEGLETDWPIHGDSGVLARRRSLSALLALERRIGSVVPDGVRTGMCRIAASATAQGAADLVSGANVVVSDRLHAHILCTLLGIPHVMVDTRYGKVGSFVETWMPNEELVQVAGSPREAIELARAIAAQPLTR
jgi:exopolysaccharide biosynthesis predicted pyruvyltransferase EpsI